MDYIERDRINRENTLKMLAKICKSYEGAINYEYLKRATPREIDILIDAMADIREEEEKEIAKIRGDKTMHIGKFQ